MQHARRKEAQDAFRRKQGGLHPDGVHGHTRAWYLEPRGMECVRNPAARKAFARRQAPTLVDQFGKADFAPSPQWIVQASDDNTAFMQQHLHISISGWLWCGHTPDHEVDVVIAQMA